MSPFSFYALTIPPKSGNIFTELLIILTDFLHEKTSLPLCSVRRFWVFIYALYATALALAFTLALNSLSGFELPIVIDTPMGDLDEDIQMNIAGFLPSYSKEKQVVLLVKSKEYTKEFRESVIDYVGKSTLERR